MIVVSPARVNLIGEHTDYNEGFVMPCAIDRFTVVHCTPSKRTNLFSSCFDSRTIFLRPQKKNSWQDYVAGIFWALQDYGIGGLSGKIDSTIPIGAGLSSSASLESAVCFALNEIYDLGLTRKKMAELCRKAECDFVGVQCGIMDQYACLLSRKDRVMLLDCRSLGRKYFPFPEELSIVVFDTGIRRKLGEKYNERRHACKVASDHFHVSSLRDVELEMIGAGFVPHERFVRHVVSENQRVLDFAEALKERNFEEMKTLMALSHKSLKEDFRVSSRELDCAFNLALRFPSCWGARMTGAGWGGCTVNLVEKKGAREFCAFLEESYSRKTGISGEAHLCHPTRDTFSKE